MNLLIVKLGATGDVVRTTTLLRAFEADFTWLTDARNQILLQDISPSLRSFSWEERERCRDRKYDLVINLEDTPEVAQFVGSVTSERLWGARLGKNGSMDYTDDSRQWFDLSMISRYGRKHADQLKFANRSTYQELIFTGLGLQFSDEQYILPQVLPSPLTGDVAIAPEAGAVWPMKKWAYYPELKRELESTGLVVNFLPKRATLLEHLADVRSHHCLVSGDSLPMHFALGSGLPCVTVFNCTSPWEICSYERQTKLVSPLLGEYFYQREYEERATRAIGLDEVLGAVITELDRVLARNGSKT